VTRRRIQGHTGHLAGPRYANERPCRVRARGGEVEAIDLGPRKPGRRGDLALVHYLHRPFVGWIREDRIVDAQAPRQQ
jgi:hypothetical protein